MAAPDTPAALLAAAVARNPAGPFLTFYDDAAGERTELSLASFDNWVAKTANLIQDGLALEPGARVQVRLPLHWQGAVWLCACWAAGVVAVPVSPGTPRAPDPPDALVSTADELIAAPAGPELVGLALRPLAVPGPEMAPGVTDFDAEVRGYADHFTPYRPVLAQAPALVVDGTVLSAAELVQAARAGARAWQLGIGERLLVVEDTPGAGGSGGVDWLLAALVSGASLVLCRNPGAGTAEEQTLRERMARERVTAVLAGRAGSSALVHSPARRLSR